MSVMSAFQSLFGAAAAKFLFIMTQPHFPRVLPTGPPVYVTNRKERL